MKINLILLLAIGSLFIISEAIYTKKYVKAKSEYLKRLYSKKENVAVTPIANSCNKLQL